MKVVLDTNVLVSAFLKPRSKPAKILRMILQGNIDIVVNEYILAEYHEVLTRPKFDLDRVNIQTVLSFIRSAGINAPVLPESFLLPDESDVPFFPDYKQGYLMRTTELSPSSPLEKRRILEFRFW